MILHSVILLAGIILGTLGSTVGRAYFRGTGIFHRELPSRGTDPVNMFDGTVFPAPHDARWRRVEARDGSGADVFVFGNRNIRLSSQALSVEEVVTHTGRRVVCYFSDVQRCYYEFRQTLALQSVDSAVLNAGFGKDETPTGDAIPEKREAPQLLSISGQQAIASKITTAGKGGHVATGRYSGPLDAGSPVFRIDDTHVLPHPSAEGWEHGKGPLNSVFIYGGSHTLSVFESGAVWLDSGEWFNHTAARVLYGLVVARLPPKESTADKQRKAADELLAKLGQG